MRHPIAIKPAAQGDGASVDARLKAMLDAVFNQRLKQDTGDEDIEGPRIDVFFDPQLVSAEAHHLDVEVVVSEAELVAQRNIGVVILEQGAKDICELDGHLRAISGCCGPARRWS